MNAHSPHDLSVAGCRNEPPPSRVRSLVRRPARLGVFLVPRPEGLREGLDINRQGHRQAGRPRAPLGEASLDPRCRDRRLQRRSGHARSKGDHVRRAVLVRVVPSSRPTRSKSLNASGASVDHRDTPAIRGARCRDRRASPTRLVPDTGEGAPRPRTCWGCSSARYAASRWPAVSSSCSLTML